MKRVVVNPSRTLRIPLNVMLLFFIAWACPMFFASGSSGGMDDAQPSSEKRDPFWPVGYVPEKKIDETEFEDAQLSAVALKGDGNWNKAMQKVTINGTSSRSGNEFYAVINGHVKCIGDTVSVSLDGSVYTWAVEGIQPPNSVKLRRVSVK